MVSVGNFVTFDKSPWGRGGAEGSDRAALSVQ